MIILLSIFLLDGYTSSFVAREAIEKCHVVCIFFLRWWGTLHMIRKTNVSDDDCESVLDGYNGTVMAYGQTGTGKTYMLGRLGDEDAARGIMVRALEDILLEIFPETDSVCVSYLQDLLDPSNYNIFIMEDPKAGDISLSGATHVEIRDQESFLELLRVGEAHRFAANTKLNTESSRSNAILMAYFGTCRKRLRKKVNSSEGVDGIEELVSGGKKSHDMGWLIGRHGSSLIKTSTQAPPQTDS
ncbi:hypothetical protein POM88_006068 [Heracleum sosnowskyi]|uniref:Kinesin motor domain-containing protein n=1 Tax=Heracleum sosnowskyi TaxID=360622 RepID=A0AAD8J5N4_9APIA|nr:hypothetical protein POM88_006068 [Heracleum sosnowskyi]